MKMTRYNKKNHNKKNAKENRRFLLLCAWAIITVFLVGILWNQREDDDFLQSYKDSRGEIIVMMKDGVEKEEIKIDSSVVVKKHIDNYLLLSTDNISDFIDVISELANHPLVDVAEANTSISSMNFTEDPYIDSQWALNNPGHYYYYTDNSKQGIASKENVDMDLVKAWEHIKTDKGGKREVVVAIIDTGVDYTHPDLAENIWVNPGEVSEDGQDNDKNGYVDDIHGWDFYNDDNSVGHYLYDDEGAQLADKDDNDNHGTHIAGIIGAVANNNIGIAGLASNIDIKIMPLKINGGQDGTGYISNAIEAIKYATMMGADICNISWGSHKYNQALEIAMEESDMLFVVAAGNEGTDNDINPMYPANYDLDNLISVTFVDPYGELTKYSNYGSTTVDVAAPGYNIYSTVVGGYAYMSGSSMAAPHVTALAALLYSYDEKLYPANIKEVILENLKPIKGLEGYVVNAGIPSALLALENSSSLKKDYIAPELEVKTVYAGTEFKISLNSYDKGGSDVRTILYMEGSKELVDFKRGTEGIKVEEEQITLTKAGYYTFYVSDYAGNETIVVYKVKGNNKLINIETDFKVTDYKDKKVKVYISKERVYIPRSITWNNDTEAWLETRFQLKPI